MLSTHVRRFVVGLSLVPLFLHGGVAVAAEDDGPPERIMFEAGSDHGSVIDSVEVGATDRYVFGAAAQQTVTVSVQDETGTAVLTVFTPAGSPLSPLGVRDWRGTLPTGGDFGIEVAATSSVTYTLSLRITSGAPADSPTPSMQPPSPPVVDPLIDVVPMVDRDVTPCDEAHAGELGYTAEGGLFVCSGQWWAQEFEGEITYVDDDRYPLRLGSSGPHVRFVQSLLVALGFDVGESGADGYYGVATYLAVFSWQLESDRSITALVTVDDMEAMRSQVESGGGTTSEASGAVPRTALEGVTVPSLCDHPAGTLVNGELPIPNEYPNGPDPGYLRLGDQIVSADLDADGTPEIAAVFHCSQGGVSWPDHIVIFHADLSFLADVDLGYVFTDVSVWRGGIQTLEVVDGHLAVSAGIEMVGTESNQYEVRGFTIDIDEGGLVLQTPGGPAGPAALGPTPLVTPASCVAGELAFGMEGRREEIALYQLTLANLGYDPGEIDGYFGPNTLNAATEEISDNGIMSDSDGQFVEFFPDDGAVLAPAFQRLGIAC